MSFSLLSSVLNFLAALFVLAIGLLALWVGVLYVVDKTQTRHAVRRNFPVIGRFRWVFEHLGEFLRPYLFAGDREELPFNRAERAWVYRAAKNLDSTVPFGSTRDLRPVGTPMFVNCSYPTLDRDAAMSPPVVIGPNCRTPYLARSIFNISAMSYGAISKPAVRALSRGAAAAGVWLNTGEGGLSPWHLEGGCDIVFQIGTAKYGVRDSDGRLSFDKFAELANIAQVRMIELKLAQGAKPGKGGILPGIKVTEEIAGIRHIPVGKDSISPNRHPEVANDDQLLDLLGRLREASGKPVGFKAVVSDPGEFRSLCAAIRRRGSDAAPDFITVDSADGGSGAAPMSLIDNVGLPIGESLPLVVDTLMEHGLRERIKVIASGKLITPTEVAWALCMGADFVNCARGFMFALGCIQAMQCNRNTCPTGVTTHNPNLQRGLVVTDKAERVAHYARNMNHEVAVIAHSCGVAEPRLLRRNHCRVVTANGKSVTLDQLFPDRHNPLLQ
ncbi:MAG: FMN-binding glutamate synthase family protein [Steroidobacteraceae bacterium]